MIDMNSLCRGVDRKHLRTDEVTNWEFCFHAASSCKGAALIITPTPSALIESLIA
jgi:hypothetical protein